MTTIILYRESDSTNPHFSPNSFENLPPSSFLHQPQSDCSK